MPKKQTPKDPPQRGRSKRQRQKNTGKNTGEPTPEPAVESSMREQAHGGALQTGNPGNKGGTGRPRNEVRAMSMELFVKRLPRLDLIAGGELTTKVIDRHGDVHEIPPPLKEQRQAIVDLGRLAGMATTVEVESPNTPVVYGFFSQYAAGQADQAPAA